MDRADSETIKMFVVQSGFINIQITKSRHDLSPDNPLRRALIENLVREAVLAAEETGADDRRLEFFQQSLRDAAMMFGLTVERYVYHSNPPYNP